MEDHRFAEILFPYAAKRKRPGEKPKKRGKEKLQEFPADGTFRQTLPLVKIFILRNYFVITNIWVARIEANIICARIEVSAAKYLENS
jgi:hypothetical protein